MDADGDRESFGGDAKYIGFHSVPPTMVVEVAAIGPTASSFFYCDGDGGGGCDDDVVERRLMERQRPNKMGSLQQFVAGEVVENLGVQNFAIRQVHKIGILDIRMLNCDRNSGNVLVHRNEYGRLELIPIDHGLAMPERLEITRDSWCWIEWKQSREPFDPFTLSFIQHIDVERDIDRLRAELPFDDVVFENMRVSHRVLLKCANSGLTLQQIGNIIARYLCSGNVL